MQDSLTLMGSHPWKRFRQTLWNSWENATPQNATNLDCTSVSSVKSNSAAMEVLAQLDKILIRQKIELLEVITSIETNNKYEICCPNGQPILVAKEDSSCCSRQCCGKERPFCFNITDFRGVPQIRVTRQYTFNCFQCCSCCSCCQDNVMVECPPGNIVGYVVQNGTCCKISFHVYDAAKQPVLFLQGPSYCLCTCPGSVHTFDILTPDKSIEVGKLRKVWSGLLKELLTDADNFELLVPPNMPMDHRALMIGATLLIDFMFFEDNSSKSSGMSLF